MEIKPTNAYKHFGVSIHTTNIVNLLYVHISVTLVAIEMRHTKDTLQKLQEPMHKSKL